MMYDLILTIKRGIHMTDFTDIKLKINGIIDKNKKIYFDSKTISDIEEFGDTKEEQKIMKLAFIPSVLFSTIFFTSISFFIAKFFFIMSSETWFLTLSLSMFFSFILSLFIYNKTTLYFINLLMKKKINNIENGIISKDEITEELFKDFFWTSTIDKETETVLKMTLPYNLYLMLHGKRPSGLNYLDVSKFLENLEKYEKEAKDIEDKRISIGIDFIKSSDIKDNVLVI